MDVSVVIPAYNGAKVLPQQLQALAQQITDASYEVIVSNNGSTDSTYELVTNIAQTGYPVPLRIIDSSEVQGVSHARNRGIAEANGEVITFCDCDDYVSDTWVQAAWEAIMQGADAVGGEIRVSNHILDEPMKHPWTRSPDSGVRKTTYGHQITGCNMGFKSSLLRDLGGFDESLPPYGTEDAEFCIRASEHNAKFREQAGFIIYFMPTTNNKVLFKKVFRSGISQTVIRHHHQERYGNSWKLLATASDLLKWMFSSSVAKTSDKKAFLRGTVVRAGSLWGGLIYTAKGWPQPKYYDFN